MVLCQSGLDLGERVCGCGRGNDSSIGEPLVGWEGFEERDSPFEEVGNLFSGLVVGVAVWVKSADAGSVLSPFVLPERLG